MADVPALRCRVAEFRRISRFAIEIKRGIPMLVLGLALFACATSGKSALPGTVGKGSAIDYYPLLPGWGWAYDVERAGSTVLALYSVSERRGDVAVVKNGDDSMEYLVLPDGIARREFGSAGDYLFKTPLRQGASWSVASGTATIVEIGKSIETPAGAFRDCLLVEEARQEPNRVTRTTYCRDTGPVDIEMRVFNPGRQAFDTFVHARLRSLSKPEDAASTT